MDGIGLLIQALQRRLDSKLDKIPWKVGDGANFY